MDDPDDLSERLIALESHLAHHERLMQDLSDMVARQWDTLNDAMKKLEQLEMQLAQSQEGEDAADEPPPPHY